VEVFPTGASIQPGHRLRIAVQAFDVPHLLPSLTGALGSLTVIEIHNSAQYPSTLTIPQVTPPAAPAASRAASRVTIGVMRPGRRHHAARVRVAAMGAGQPATGRVEVLLGRRVLSTRSLRDGRARVLIPARLVKHGTHRITARYLGTSSTAPSSASTRWRVR
jgi:hypothetical protein